jgi:hypothetical protein
VFISYSHADSEFADRLVSDLVQSEVHATYDKWLLRVGDSIIEKISQAVADSDKIIALLSPASVSSNWVKKELSFAMTGEIQNRKVLLPAIIATCEIPPIISDKLYADFRSSYYRGLRELLQALRPDFYELGRYTHREKIVKAARALKKLLLTSEISKLREWFGLNGYALAALFGRLWLVSEAIPRFALGSDTVDFMVINGQSGRYELSLIVLGNPAWDGRNTNELAHECERIKGLLRWCKEHDQVVRQYLAVRMASSYGAEQIAPEGYVNKFSLQIDAKLLCGRREIYTNEQNAFRNKIYEDTSHSIDIISYDRVVDALEKVAIRH